MKVVLFCGGLGMRLRDYSESVPKPLVPIGPRPILWHIMKYYAHYGHKDFILALGWRGDAIKEYFLNYDECVSNNFVLRQGEKIDLLHSDIHDWTMTFVDTGLSSNVAQRLKALEPYLAGEDFFLANYSDGVSDLHLPTLVDHAHERNAIATFMAVRPHMSMHLMDATEDGYVTKMTPVATSDFWMNAGFFVFKTDIFQHIHPGDELVVETFERLIAVREVTAMRHSGFWACMDTFKEKQTLDELYNQGAAPWCVWSEEHGNDDHPANRASNGISKQPAAAKGSPRQPKRPTEPSKTR